MTGLTLKAYPKTSGGHGLHIYVPLAAGYSFEVVRAWVKTVGEQLAAHSRLAGRTIKMGSLVVFSTRSVTLPITQRSSPWRPCVDIAIRS